MTTQEKLDRAVIALGDAAAVSVLLAILALLLLAFIDEATDMHPKTASRLLGLIVFVEVLFLAFCAVGFFYLRLYLPLQGVA